MTFAVWQPRYAEVGIPSFPVEGKRPGVKGYLKLGLKTSGALAAKYGDKPSFGISLQRAKITVLDVDTSDERVLADALDRHGRTPVIVRSGSGNWQAWYRSSGEGRRIRPNPALPVDLLGAGFTVAPASQGSAGVYAFVEGRLEDLPELPALGGQEWSKSTTNTYTLPPASGELGGVGLGSRNSALWRFCMQQARHCDDADALLDVARTTASAFATPLPDDEVTKVALSAWRYEAEGRNWVGLGGKPPLPASEPEGLLWINPDAFVLWTMLRHHHAGRMRFFIANAMAETMPGGGWSRKRLADARRQLVEDGHVLQVRAASMKAGAAVYAWGRS